MSVKQFSSLGEKDKQLVLEKVTSFLEARQEIIFAYVFGSFLDSYPLTFRDIDIGVYLKKKVSLIDYQVKLSTELSEKVGLPVDVRLLNEAPERFVAKVLSQGKIIFNQDETEHSDVMERVSLYASKEEHIANQSFKELFNKK